MSPTDLCSWGHSSCSRVRVEVTSSAADWLRLSWFFSYQGALWNNPLGRVTAYSSMSIRRNEPDVRMWEVAVMSLSSDSGRITDKRSHMDCVRVGVKPTRTHRVAKLCLRLNTTNQDWEDMCVKQNGAAGQRVPGSSAGQAESTIVGVRSLLDWRPEWGEEA